MKPHLQCAEQQVSRSNLTKYCACHAKWLAYSVRITYKTSYQTLRQPRRKTHILSLHHMSRSNLTKYCTCHAKLYCKFSHKIFENRWDAYRNPPRKWGYFSTSPQTFFILKYKISRPILQTNLHQILCLPRKVPLGLNQVLHLPPKVTLELHQVLHLPRKVTLKLHPMLRLSRRKPQMLNPHHISNLIYNARSNRHHDTSPNAAPATENNAAKFQRKSPKTGKTLFPIRE